MPLVLGPHLSSQDLDSSESGSRTFSQTQDRDSSHFHGAAYSHLQPSVHTGLGRKGQQLWGQGLQRS